ncbi:hypothetical protein, conserved [Eimeria brunetti]|uniref:BSD domain-containing protein n=1 Tax=Eimeria brunetti TaxID=51314 RepID=U6LSD3_9EIME|nr:hypothetical protein, conserved [Eimeria brunetti]
MDISSVSFSPEPPPSPPAMVPTGPEGNTRPAQTEEPTEPAEARGPGRLASSLSHITSRLSTATGCWGKWLLNSASDFVVELGAESEDTKNDLKEFCHVIVSDSTAWIRRRRGNSLEGEAAAADASGERTGDASSSSDSSNSSRDTAGSGPDEERSSSSSSSSSCCEQPSVDDSNTGKGRTEAPPPSPPHTAGAQSDKSKEGPPLEPSENPAEPPLPIWWTDPAIRRRFRLIATSDVSYTSDPEPMVAAGCGCSTQQQQQQQQQQQLPEPDDDICEVFLARNAAVDPPQGDGDEKPSESEIKMYMKDPHVAAARQRLVPKKVTEELFWRRFHARVRRMVGEEEKLSVHLSKLKAPTKPINDSESEEDISWEDLGSDEEGTF